jgi:altronate dehydratase
MQKDGTAAFMDVYEYARQIREGTLSWEEVEKNDLESVRVVTNKGQKIVIIRV